MIYFYKLIGSHFAKPTSGSEKSCTLFCDTLFVSFYLQVSRAEMRRAFPILKEPRGRSVTVLHAGVITV